MKKVDEAIHELTDKSDIAFQSNIYEEIKDKLTNIGLKLAFFIFKTREHSFCSRDLDGNHVSCPVLTLYLNYDADFRQTGIDRHNGNWDDKWAQTRTIRNALNEMLERYGFDNDFVSDDTLIFVQTREQIAFRQIGEDFTDEIKKLVCAEAAGVNVEGVYWNGTGYYVVMKDKADYKRVKKSVKAKVTKTLPKLLANADKGGYCQEYATNIEFGYGGCPPMNFF